MGRILKELPKFFNRAKIEYERLINLFWCSRLTEDKKRDETPENIGLFYLLSQEFMNFAENHFHNTGEKILQLMEKNNTDKVYLYDYGKVIRHDKEAQWLFIEDISQSEWKDYDINSSVSFSELKKKGKERNND